MKTYLAITFLFLSTLALPEKSLGWGDQGHSITALVAQKLLQDDSSDEAKNTLKAINTILGDTTIDAAAIWPDQVKNESRACKPTDKVYNNPKICNAYKYTSNWHFVTPDDKKAGYTLPASDKYFKGDTVLLIRLLSHQLKGDDDTSISPIASFDAWKSECLGKANHQCKKEALSFLIHFVGDLHQPLHSGAGCDAGGNAQRIKFFGEDNDPDAVWCTPQDPPTCSLHELHQAWDTSLLVHAPVGNPISYVSNKDYSLKLVGLMKQNNPQSSSDQNHCVNEAPNQPIDINSTTFPMKWAEESMCYVPQVYTFPDDKLVKANTPARKVAQIPAQPVNLCSKSRQHGEGFKVWFDPFNVGPQYAKNNIPTINERLYWGGYRLATLLKVIYGQKGDQSTKFD